MPVQTVLVRVRMRTVRIQFKRWGRITLMEGGRSQFKMETLDNEKEVVNPEVVPEVRAASCQL
jgi:hypothetical protein